MNRQMNTHAHEAKGRKGIKAHNHVPAALPCTEKNILLPYSALSSRGAVNNLHFGLDPGSRSVHVHHVEA